MIREVIGAEVGEPGREVFQKLLETIQSDPETYGRRLTALDAAFSRAASEIVTRMAAVDRPVGIADLPADYRSAFFSGRGERNLVTILPADGMFESLTAMEQFSVDLARIDERITGFVQIALEWTQESFESSIRAGIFILIVVLITLALEFQSLRWAAAAAFPLLVGMIWMLGLYPLFGMKINAINLAMVPLVIGMAVDFGIHLVHRYREEGDVGVTYSYTGKAVFLSAMTTMVGFGSLALVGEFKSIALIGAILFLGIASAWAVSTVLLPALLREPRREE
jgi:predicted RND superfamily exporter protein